MALPGFGKQKAQIFVALLAKQLGVRPEGWEQAVGDYALEGYRSVADVVDPASLQKVRDYKQEKKAAAKAAQRLTAGTFVESRAERRGWLAASSQRPGPWQNDSAALDHTGPCRAHVSLTRGVRVLDRA